MTPQDSPHLSVKDAARRLGISPEAVRKRLDRGTLHGVKRGRVWLVSLSAEDAPQDAVPDARGMPPDAAPDALVAHLQDEVAFLRGELESRTEELRRKDHLLAAALECIPELPATVEDAAVSETRAPLSDVPLAQNVNRGLEPDSVCWGDEAREPFDLRQHVKCG